MRRVNSRCRLSRGSLVLAAHAMTMAAFAGPKGLHVHESSPTLAIRRRARAHASAAQARPPQPGYAYAAECAGEGLCARGPWIALDSATAYRAVGDRRAVAFRLRPRQRVRGLRGRYVVRVPGLVVFDSARAPFGAGDTVVVLGYVGEGNNTLWHRGAVHEGAPDGSGVRRIRTVHATWWVEVGTRTGARGWIPFPERGARERQPLVRADSRY